MIPLFWGAVIGGAISLYSSRKSSRSADQALGRQGASMQEAIDLGREHMDFARGEYQQWRQEFAPIMDALAAEALAGREPDFAAITADTRMAFDSARGQQQRHLERRGINPGDGQYGENDRQHRMAAAAAEVGARDSARRDAKNDRFEMLSSVGRLSSSIGNQAMASTGAAVGGLMGAFGNQAAMHGQHAQMHGNNAAASGRALGGLDWGSVVNRVFNRDEPEEPGGD